MDEIVPIEIHKTEAKLRQMIWFSSPGGIFEQMLSRLRLGKMGVWTLALCAVFFGCANSSRAHGPASGTPTVLQTASPTLLGSDNAPLVVRMEGAPTPEEESAKEERSKQERELEQRWAVGIGVATILAAAVQALILIWQIVYLRGTVVQMRASEGRQLRAYLSATPNFIHSFNAETKPRARRALSNHGVSPAHSVRQRGDIGLMPYPPEVHFEVPAVTTPWSSPTIIFPQSQLTGVCVGSRAFTGSEIEQIQAANAAICIYGEVVYEDVFGKEHATHFCSFVAVNGDGLEKLTSLYGPDDLKIDFVAAPTGNAAT